MPAPPAPPKAPALDGITSKGIQVLLEALDSHVEKHGRKVAGVVSQLDSVLTPRLAYVLRREQLSAQAAQQKLDDLAEAEAAQAEEPPQVDGTAEPIEEPTES